ncbi:uncharacterized protein LOC129146707 isoform X2 [Talpa occidentalis]|uniref:uncharacterized protein LOC129146707 isoform X2 n=1 Tax=Talpa occidentalis TaxID=50954 RepID=UPI0023F74C7E|nr:uncharacterized protein LOC129146707 isoform X2 [Talpa occidentalis]
MELRLSEIIKGSVMGTPAAAAVAAAAAAAAEPEGEAEAEAENAREPRQSEDLLGAGRSASLPAPQPAPLPAICLVNPNKKPAKLLRTLTPPLPGLHGIRKPAPCPSPALTMGVSRQDPCRRVLEPSEDLEGLRRTDCLPVMTLEAPWRHRSWIRSGAVGRDLAWRRRPRGPANDTGKDQPMTPEAAGRC